MKFKVVSIKTNHQDIHIYDTFEIVGNSNEAGNAHFFQPSRSIFLNGVLQSTSRGKEAYHETLVHPAMFAHESPKNVAIIGGGDGATLREVLKHKTVEKVLMLSIDKTFVELSHEYLTSWNDCSDLINSTSSCFDDPRVQLISGESVHRFFQRLSNNEPTKFDVISSVQRFIQRVTNYESEIKFDVIIVDAK